MFEETDFSVIFLVCRVIDEPFDNTCSMLNCNAERGFAVEFELQRQVLSAPSDLLKPPVPSGMSCSLRVVDPFWKSEFKNCALIFMGKHLVH